MWWPLDKLPQSYRPVKTEIEESDSIDLDDSSPQPDSRWRFRYVVALCVFVVGAILGLVIFDYVTSFSKPAPSPDTTTSNCPQRREWRTLSPEEQQHYISSVQCLSTIDSALPNHPNSSLHEDFPWIHAHVGYATHHSAAFLPWHRYFLHVYHDTLRRRCGYTGELVYWDWTLDWADLAHSPVFDAARGFGGDGDPHGRVTVGNSGRCVVDGPFAGLRAKFYDVQYRPHCLSRGFRTDAGAAGVIDGALVHPDRIAAVLRREGYEAFVAAMESEVHDAIPFGIAGDFETFTAPYDPLFFLHHAQLDRLWWRWQRRAGAPRAAEYAGHRAKHTMAMASLDDEMHMQALAPPVRVRELMETEQAGGLLCYRY